jgi:hypothetical protein
MTTLIIIRGNDKSQLAKKLQGFSYYEVSMYFQKIRYDENKLPAAHRWCKWKVREALSCGANVIVGNTVTRACEMGEYLDIADELNAAVVVI